MLYGIIEALFGIVKFIFNMPFWLFILIVIIIAAINIWQGIFGNPNSNNDEIGGYGKDLNHGYDGVISPPEFGRIKQPFVFYDYRGNRCGRGDCFYDSNDECISWGEGFCDGEGYDREWGDSYYDAQGIYRQWGDCFYDTQGNLVYPD